MYVYIRIQSKLLQDIVLFQIVTWYQRPRVLKAGDYCLKLSLVIIPFVLVVAVLFFF